MHFTYIDIIECRARLVSEPGGNSASVVASDGSPGAATGVVGRHQVRIRR